MDDYSCGCASGSFLDFSRKASIKRTPKASSLRAPPGLRPIVSRPVINNVDGEEQIVDVIEFEEDVSPKPKLTYKKKKRAPVYTPMEEIHQKIEKRRKHLSHDYDDNPASLKKLASGAKGTVELTSQAQTFERDFEEETGVHIEQSDPQGYLHSVDSLADRMQGSKHLKHRKHPRQSEVRKIAPTAKKIREAGGTRRLKRRRT